MKCPHFSKVNFQRIKEIKNQQYAFQEQHSQGLNNSIFSIESISEEIFNVPQEGIDHVNNFKSKISNYKYTFNNLHYKQQSIKESSKIKMPKQMNIKRMIIETQMHVPHKPLVKTVQKRFCQLDTFSPQKNQSQLQVQIPSQHDSGSSRKNPHILVSKNSLMTHECLNIFNGFIFLTDKQQNSFQCVLKDLVIRITKQDKIKYFIQLQKVKVNIQEVHYNDRGIQLNLKCKSKNDSIIIYFISPFQKQIFIQVYQNCIRKIKQIRKLRQNLESDKQNLIYATNSFNQSLEEQQSAIFSQKNQLNQNQSFQSISSLSINSYEGDSLVFQTERISFSHVKQMGNTFDVLLFKNKSLMSKVQRIFTNSDYDHVAMLLRTASNELLMLQATSNSGVAIYTFNSLLKIDKTKYFSRIGLKRYVGEKNLIKISRLQNFIKKTVGKKYKFDPMYLIKSQANEQKQTFFCSQLVAEALQDVGILSNSYPSFKYLPKHFAEQTLNNQIIDGKYSDTIILQ